MRPEDRRTHSLYLSVIGGRTPSQPAPGDVVQQKKKSKKSKKRIRREERAQYALIDSFDPERAAPPRPRPFAVFAKFAFQVVFFTVNVVILVIRLRAFLAGKPADDTGSLAYDASTCPQAEGLTPSNNAALLHDLEAEFSGNEFKLKAYESLGGAVRIPYVY